MWAVDPGITRRDVIWCAVWSLVLVIMSASMSPLIVPLSIIWLSLWWATLAYGERLQRRADAEEDWLRGRMADILTRTANALKGEPDGIYSHDWSDLPDVAARLRSELADRRRGLAVSSVPPVNVHASCAPGECGVCSPPVSLCPGCDYCGTPA
jgi:hypothetical protein